MSDYISREAAIEYLTLNMGWNDEDGYPVDDWEERKANIADLINGIPAADVQPNVTGITCKTCKHSYKHEPYMCRFSGRGFCGDDFCSEWERIDDE